MRQFFGHGSPTLLTTLRRLCLLVHSRLHQTVSCSLLFHCVDISFHFLLRALFSRIFFFFFFFLVSPLFHSLSEYAHSLDSTDRRFAFSLSRSSITSLFELWRFSSAAWREEMPLSRGELLFSLSITTHTHKRFWIHERLVVHSWGAKMCEMRERKINKS